MVTDPAQHHPMFETARGLVARVGGQVRQFLCGLHGHDSLLHFEQGRISLLCSSCGYETPGWDVKAAPPRRDGAPSRRLVSLRLVGQRRVA